MTGWKIVHCDASYRPEELDTTSSPDTVYKRRNFIKISIPSTIEGEPSREEWEYEEMEMSFEEYYMLNALSDTVTFAHDDQIVDNYTAKLIAEGVI